MIELTEQQIQSLGTHESTPPRVVNPQTKEKFVLLRVEEYERLTEDEYDDSPWTREELEALAWEAGKSIGWEDMDDYDDIPEAPDDELRPEYDFRAMRGVVLGKYAKRYRERLRIVRLAEDVAASFPDEAAVNDALREYLRGRRAAENLA